jgi:hypothetical protein
MFEFTAGSVQPSDVIVVLHVLNDFQAAAMPDGIIPRAGFNADGLVDVPESEYLLRHDLWHTVIRGYDPPNPAQTVQSHLFLADLLGGALSRATGQLAYLPDGYSNNEHVTPEQPFAGLEYLFTTDSADPRAAEALRLITTQLDSWRAKVEESGAVMRLVILPYYPAAYYSGDGVVEGYDLFAPERALQAYALENNIPVLPLGQYWEAAGFTAAELQPLFLREGVGHFSVQGHQAVADAIYGCFYAGQPEAESAFASVGCPAQ